MELYAVRYGYDVFLSHSTADKTWVRDLAKRLADTDFNGRPLRPWLDEQILDPRLLSSNDELTSTINQSRVHLLFLSTNSAASPWLKFEIEYFAERRRECDVVVLLKETCGLPGLLEYPKTVIDFSTPSHFEDAYWVLVRMICRGIDETPEEARARIDPKEGQRYTVRSGRALARLHARERCLMESLLQLDIGDSAGEGPALTAFEEAGMRIAHIV